MDNFHIDVVSDDDTAFGQAMAIAFGKRRTATHFAVITVPNGGVHGGAGDGIQCKTLVFLAFSDGAPVNATRFVAPLSAEHATIQARLWLESLPDECWGCEPDHDGHNRKGWRVFVETWGRVAGLWGTIVAVQPAWAMYGK